MKRTTGNDRELLKGTTPLLILAVLATQPLHGYGIVRAIEDRSRQQLSLGEGSLYPALHALERDGLLHSAWHTDGNGPARKVYALTEKGHVALARHQHTWFQFVTTINTILGGSPDGSPA